MKEYVIDIKKWQRPCIYMLIKRSENTNNDVIVYVGQSKRGIERVFEHKDKDFDYIKYIPCSRLKLDEKERELIQKWKPKYNLALNQKKINEIRQCCFNCKFENFDKYIEINNISDDTYYDDIVPTYCIKHKKNIESSFEQCTCKDFKLTKDKILTKV